MSAKIPLSRGAYAKVDRSDLKAMSAIKWHLSPGRHTNYARADSVIGGVRFRTYMHRLLLNAPDGVVVDHINGDGLDNRRSNLRLTSHSGNGHNRKRFKNPNGHIGISWDKQREKWKAQIMVNYKQKLIGRYATKAEAITARRAAEKELT